MIAEAYSQDNPIISIVINLGGAVMSISRSLAAIVRFLLACQADAHSRRALTLLDRRLLRDIGVTHTEARRAAARPLWLRSRSRMGAEFPDRRRARSALRKAPEC
jgi:uncharacterized protein YjiS (DUF1127 family)